MTVRPLNPAQSSSTATKPSERHLRDFRWRLANLYYIKAKSGRTELLKPNAAQMQVIEALAAGKRRLLTPKSRQLGISTISIILALDAVLFSPGTGVGIVHLTDKLAQNMVEKLVFAYDLLPDWLKDEVKLTKQTGDTLRFSNGSTLDAGISLRGSTFQFLIISEIGPIQKLSEVRAREVIEGLIPTVPNDGLIICESTSIGPTGWYYDQCMIAEKQAELERAAWAEGRSFYSNSPWTSIFLPWFISAEYQTPIPPGDDWRRIVSPQTQAYFSELQRELRTSGIAVRLTPAQALWYQRQRQMSSSAIFREYPSTINEAFLATSEDAIYAEELTQARLDQRISVHHGPDRSAGPLYISFDLGGQTKHSDNTVLTFAQFDGPRTRVLHAYKAKLTNFEDYVDYIIKYARTHRLRIAALILPHDSRNQWRGSSKTVEQVLLDAGVGPVVVVPRTSSVWGDLSIIKTELPYCTFWMAPPDFGVENDGCRVMLTDLQVYRRKRDRSTGMTYDEPHHGPESDTADSFRTLLMAKYAGMLNEFTYLDAFDGHTFGGDVFTDAAGYAPQRGAWRAHGGYEDDESSIATGGGGFGTTAD